MRAALSIVMATLILGLGHDPTFAKAQAGDVPSLGSIHMVDALTGWAVTDEPGAGRVLHTSDGGTHWVDVSPLKPSRERVASYRLGVLTSLVAWVALSDTAAWALTGTTHIFRTVDGGRMWRNVAVPALDARSIYFVNPHDGWLLSGEWDGSGMGREAAIIYWSADGGATWFTVARTSAHDESSGLPVAGAKMAIMFQDATTGWITGGGFVSDQLHLYVTHDGGRAWRQQKIPLPPQVTSPWQSHPMPPRFFTAQDGILAVEYDYGETQSPPSYRAIVVFYVTHDGGTTWAYTTPVPARLTSWDSPPSFADMNHGWATDGHALYATKDGGRHWTAIRPAPPLAVVELLDFVSPQIGWAVGPAKFSDGTHQTPPFLLRTVDGGYTWTPVTYTISRQ